MKILTILDEKFPHDIRVENEIEILQCEGHEIHIACRTFLHKNSFEILNGIHIHRLYLSSILFKIRALYLGCPLYYLIWKRFLKKLVRNNVFDIIHVHDLTLINLGVELANELNIPVIGDLRENKPEILKLYNYYNTTLGKLLISLKKWHKYQIKMANKVDALILVTEEAKNYYHLKYNIPKEKMYVFPNYMNLDKLNRYKIELQLREKYQNKFVVIYFGNTGIRRGILTMIHAAHVLKEIPNIHFIIIGDSREQIMLENEIKKLNLKNVELIGYIDEETAMSYISAANLGACPFLRNNHHDTTVANKMFQYMAYGVPVIASNCPSQVNIINKYQCGVIFKAGNVEDFVSKLLAFYKDKEFQNIAITNCRNAIKNDLNTESSKNELVAMYNMFNKNKK